MKSHIDKFAQLIRDERHWILDFFICFKSKTRKIAKAFCSLAFSCISATAPFHPVKTYNHTSPYLYSFAIAYYASTVGD